MARALRYDGIIPTKQDVANSFSAFTAAEIRDLVRYVKDNRTEASPIDIVIEGVTPAERPEEWVPTVGPLAEAGATWWIESMWDVPGGLDAVRRRVHLGPPRVA